MKEGIKLIIFMILCGILGGALAGNGIYVTTWEFWTITLVVELLLVLAFKAL